MYSINDKGTYIVRLDFNKGAKLVNKIGKLHRLNLINSQMLASS